MQDSSDATQEGCLTGGMLKKVDIAQEEAGKDERRDAGQASAGQVGCRNGGMQERRDAGHEGCWSGAIKERRDA